MVVLVALAAPLAGVGIGLCRRIDWCTTPFPAVMSYGKLPIAGLERRHVRTMMDNNADSQGRPGSYLALLGRSPP